MKKVLTTVIILIVVIGGIGWILSNNKKKNEEKTAIVAQGSGAVTVRTSSVTKQPLDLDFSVNGNFLPSQDLTFSAENSGRITRILVDVGSKVNKGQIIAYLDSELLNVTSSNAQATYDNAKKDLERFESSFKTGGVTQQQLDAQRLNVERALATLKESNRKLSDANIKAPINGIVNKKLIEVGTYVSPGTQLFEIVDVSKLKLSTTVTESQVAALKIGDNVKITTNVYPDKSFNGKVSFIAPKADNSLNFPIEIELSNNQNNDIRAGMYGTAVFEFAKQAPVVIIPRTAFVGSVSSNKVFIANGDHAKERQVVAGRILGDQVEILSGLQEGEIVIVSGQINLVDGTQISAIK
ncbi:efflux RND transporter periplasmic adaptor subunit [Pseudopedobacter beijingensis]|uniref:Efflux RND transporter periplasmic adaptor subunit n=1 Tax=Pseudopedobacter beijingensis TaxID=1207056 RepID=A0ABW4I8P5_9SPHI